MSFLRFKRDVLLVGLSLLLSLTAVFSFYHLLPVFLSDLGFSEKSLGYFYTVFLFSYNFGQLAGGLFLRRISPRTLYALSTFLVALALFIISFLKSRILIVFVLFIVYFLWGVQLPPQGVIVHDAEEDAMRGFSQIEFFALIGILIGPFFGYALLKYLSLTSVIFVAAIIEVVVSVLRYLVKTQGEVPQNKVRFPKLTREVLIITAFVSLSFFVFYSTADGPFIPSIMKEVLGLNMRSISLVFGISTLVSIAFIPIFYALAHRFGMWLVMGLSVVFHGLLIYLWSLNFSALFILVFAFVSLQPVYTYFMPVVMENVSLSERGGAVGLVGFVSGTIGSISPMLLSYSKNPFFYAFLVSLLASIIVLLYPLRHKGF